MRLIKFIILSFGICAFCSLSVKAQIPTFSPQLYVFQDSLTELGKKMLNDEEGLERKNATYVFIKTLVSALKLPNSFDFPFDSLKYVAIINSPDNSFRIFNWHHINDDKTYRYYGAIQINNPEKLELYPLVDYSPFITNMEDTITNNGKWFGAHYYEIVPKKYKGDKSYVLLGWKGHSRQMTQKVIEVLTFDEKGKPVFGAPIFKHEKKTKSRVVFQFTSNANMLLRYDEDEDRIIFDHLSPPNPNTTGMFETYGPDLSYDALEYKRGEWNHMENLDLRNKKNRLDKFKPGSLKEKSDSGSKFYLD